MTASQPARLHLRVLATSDLHGYILPWDDLSDRPAPDRGLAQIASLIAAARAEVPDCLVVDNGDFLNGSPLSDHVAETWAADPGRVHPMIEAMNCLGYDAATLGNHEFSHGLDLLTHALAQARFAVVATNLSRVNPATGRSRAYLPRHLLLRRTLTDQTGTPQPLTIGILGFLPPQTALWERRHLAGQFMARGILPSARAAVARLRRAGADVVIALSHSGLGGAADRDEAENVSCALAGIAGIDAVVAGHTHQIYPALPGGNGAAPAEARPLARHDKPLVMPGFFGSHLGVIDLTLERAGRGWRIAGHQSELRPVIRRVGPLGQIEQLAQPEEAIAALAARETGALRRRAAAPVGQTTVALQSFFALIGHCPVQTLLAEVQAQNMRALMAGLPEAALPMLVAGAPFKAGGRGGPSNYTDIPAGRLTARNIADLYIHPNTPVALRMTGADIAHWLERSVSLFRQVPPGARDATLIDADFPAFNFDMIHGLTCQIDLAQPARFDSLGQLVNADARRIAGLCHAGRPVAPDQSFVLVTNNYRAGGGAGFAGTDAPQVVMEESRPLRRVLQDYLAAQGPVAPRAAADWSFLPMPDTSVLFDTGPGAAAHAAGIAGLEPVGPQPSGFLRFRLRL